MVAWFTAGIVCAMPFATLCAQASRPQPVVRGYAAAADISMRIYVPAGRVRIAVWARDSVHVKGTTGQGVTVFGGGSRTHMKFGIESRVPGDTLPEADLEVSVPRGARVWLKMIDGRADVTGITGEIELYAVRGDITVQDVSGVTSIESIDAPVTVRRARGDLRVRGGKGAVIIDDARGTMSVATVSGPVTLTNVVADGRVETIGGAIALTATSLAGATMELQSHSGDITLALDPRRAPLLDLSSRAGPVLGTAPKGMAVNGQLSARSFKGRITVGGITSGR